MLNSFLRYTVGLLVLYLHCAYLQAQQYSFYYPDANKELPQQFIYALETDKEGYLWVGTGEGIVKFNGKNLKAINHDGKPCQDFCTALLNFKDQIIAGFNDGTIAITKNHDLSSFSEKANSKIVAFATNSEEVYAASQNMIYLIGENTLTSIYTIPGGDVIYSVVCKGKNIIIGHSGGITSYDTGTQKVRQVSTAVAYKLLNTAKEVLALSDSTLLSVQEKGVRTICTIAGAVFQPGSAMAVSENKLFVSGGSVLYQLSGSPGKAVEKVFALEDESILINSIFPVNRQLWLGTYGLGLAFIDPSSYFTNPGKGETRPTLGLAKVSGGFAEINLNAVKIFREGPDKLPRLPASEIFISPYALSGAGAYINKQLVLGTDANGIVLLDMANGGFRPFTKLNSKLPPAKKIISIDNDNKSNIWVTVAQHGAFLFTGSGDLLQHYTTQNGLVHNDIFKVYTDSRNSAWFITAASGLSKLTGDQWQYYTLKDGLSSLEFTDIAEDKTGNIWLTTAGGGLTRIAGNSIENYNTESGLSADYFYGIATRDNTVYTYSREAINILQGARLRKIESNEIGFIPNFVPRSMVMEHNWLAIGSEKGVVFHYFVSTAQPGDLKLLIRDCLVNDKTTIANDTRLEYGNYKLAFNVEEVSLNPYYQAELEFMLEGFDREWQLLTRETVIYQSVRDGEYRFIVREKANPRNQVVFTFIIDQPFWKKPVYYVLAVIFITAMVYFIFRLRLKRLEERNKELEEKVEERTAELIRKNKELEQFSYAISHDLKNPAINIVELVRILKEDEIEDPEMTKEVFQQLDISSEKMLKTLLDLISILKYANAKELPKEEVNIAELIEEIKQSIGHSINEANGIITYDLSGFKTIRYNRANLYSIFYNLISNGIKYRKPDVNPVIEIRTFTRGGACYASVKDNGLGIDMKKNGDKLFGMFQRLHSHVEGSGIGLHLVKSIITKNGGDIEVESEPGNGTEFILKLRPAKH